MRRTALLAAAVMFFVAPSAFAGLCTPTGLVRDNIDLTAALINPETVSGPVDATGCNIGVYYGPGAHGVVKDAEIFGANYFGIVADGDATGAVGAITVDVVDSTIRDIGETPHTGGQHGVAIYVRACSEARADAIWLMGRRTSGYQKGGIVANGAGTRAIVDRNTVTGDGHV